VLLGYGFDVKAQSDSIGNTKFQLGHVPNRHVVILIDAAPAQSYQYLLQDNSKLPGIIDKFLKEKNLYNDGDYLSVLSYSLGAGNLDGHNLERFITTPKNRGELLAWKRPKSNNPLRNLSGNWASISYGQHLKKLRDPIGSLNSLRLYYALHAVSCSDENLAANSLYIITISDEIHQGNDDIAGELRKLLQISPLDLDIQKNIQEESLSFSNSVKKNFTFLTDPSKLIIDKSNIYPFQLVVTEIKPSRDPSIQNMLHLPAMPDLKRVRGGYRLDIKVPQIDSTYKLEKMELTISASNEDNKLYETTDDYISVTLPTQTVLSDSVCATLRAWVRFNDGVYNALVLNPYDKANLGLSMSQQLVTRDEPKILGFLRVSDALWFSFLPDTYENVIIAYSTIVWLLIVAAIVALAMYLIKKVSTYVPTIESIRISPVEKIYQQKREKLKDEKSKNKSIPK
jgi:hypothetical protein